MKNLIIFIPVLGIIFFLLKKFKGNSQGIKKFKGMEEPKYFFKIEPTGNLLNDFVKFIQLKEGGLSRDKTDSASANPSPYRLIGKDGVYHSDWHTNKGVTYEAFKKLSSKLGYINNEVNFSTMPIKIWFDIFSAGYYAPFKNLTKSELINLYLSSWAWGSGTGGAKNLLKKIGININEMINSKGENYTLAFLVTERIKFFERLVIAKPQNQKFLQGWKNSALSFYKNFKQFTKN